MSIVGYDNPGGLAQLSPSIWDNCPKTLLNDKGFGVFVFENFQTPVAISTTVDSVPFGRGDFSFKGDTDTSINSVDDSESGIVDVETDSTAGDAGVFVANAFAKIVLNSGNPVWFEALVAPGDVDDDMGTFIGLVEEDGADEDVIADDPASNTSTANVSLIGFFQNNGDANAYNAIYKNDTDTAVEVLADVTNATAIDSGSRVSLIDGVAATLAGFHKLGITFDGRDKLKFWVDGINVATQVVDSTVDQTNFLAPIVAVKTGDSQAEKIFVGFIACAYQTLH